jgi:hypothetical protein
MKITARMFSAGALLLAGCASAPAPWKVSPDQHLMAPPPDKAQIIFLHPANAVQAVSPTLLYETSGNSPEFLGLMGPHSKMVELVEPGKHMFVANTGAYSHVLAANVQAGKRYYVLLRFIYARGFQLRPLRAGGPSDYTIHARDFESWRTQTNFVEPAPGADAFRARFAEDIEKARLSAMQDWREKRPDQRAELTLNPEDAAAP